KEKQILRTQDGKSWQDSRRPELRPQYHPLPRPTWQCGSEIATNQPSDKEKQEWRDRDRENRGEEEREPSVLLRFLIPNSQIQFPIRAPQTIKLKRFQAHKGARGNLSLSVTMDTNAV